MSIDKVAIKTKMLALENEQLLFSEARYNEFFEGAKLDRSETIDHQDHSQAKINSLLAEQFHCPIEDHEEALKILKKTDFAKKDTVEPGAIVRFNKKNFVVSIASDSFESDGQTFIGISTAAPIYQEMEDAEKGDTFEFNGKTFEIESIN